MIDSPEAAMAFMDGFARKVAGSESVLQGPPPCEHPMERRRVDTWRSGPRIFLEKHTCLLCGHVWQPVFWCNAHGRLAVECLGPRAGGLLRPCQVVNLTHVVEVEPA